MPVHHELTSIALVAVGALICGMVLTRLKQPAIVGYIVAGVVLGPSGFSFIEDREQINLLAELGVLLLVFLIGMELSLRAFKRVLGIAILVSLLQIVASLAVMLLLSRVLGWPAGLAVLLGFAVALSSTAVAIRMLDDIGELRSQVGRRAVGILIAQDLAVVPMMLVLNAMASESGIDAGALLPMVVAVALLTLFVWFLSRAQKISLPMSRWVAGDHDLMPLAALAYCFAAAAVSGLLGLSAAYGAFLAGLLIGNSTDRQAMLRTTHPIQSILLMAFFLSIGLLIDLDYIWANLGTVVLLLLIVTLGKTVMNVAVLRLFGEQWTDAFLIGVVLGQVGEFSFVLAAVGLGSGLIDVESHRLVVAIIALGLVISPIWLAIARRLNNLAVTGISTLNELIDALYPDETAVVRETAGTAAQGASRFAATLRGYWRNVVGKRRGLQPNPASATPEPAAAEMTPESPPPQDREGDA
jgi:CPA2 family monovalent cation:H+ antiporter-2